MLTSELIEMNDPLGTVPQPDEVKKWIGGRELDYVGSRGKTHQATGFS
jgi:hypothetical protein